MAKTLNQFLEGYLKVKNPDEQKFVDKHVVAKHPDRNGNDDGHFKGKTKQIDRRKERHGYNPGEDEKVYEETLGESTYEFDISGEHGNAAVDKLVRHANSKGIKAKVHTYNGPGGGNPVIHLSHKDPKAVHSYVKKHIDPDVDLSHHKINEELKGNQHKLDKNHNGKLDAHDFKLLRKKKIAEGMDKVVDNGHTPIGRATQHAAKLISSHTKRKHYFDGGDLVDHETDKTVVHNAASKPIHVVKKLAKDYHAGVKEEAEQIDEISKKTAISAYAKRNAKAFNDGDYDDEAEKDYNKLDKQAGRIKRKFGKATLNKAGHAAHKEIFGEEAEQIDELSRDTLRRYRMKAKSIGDNEKGDINYRSKGRDLAARKTHGGQWGIPKAKVMASEEVEQIDETAKVVAHLQKRYGDNIRKSHVRSAANDFGVGYVALAHAVRKKLGVNRLEEEQVDEVLTAKTPMGTYIKDFQKSDAPQFKGKSKEKRRVMAIAAKLTAERGGKPLRKEEKLIDLLSDLTESHRRTMLSVFDKLNEDNQKKFLAACQTPEGVESMLDFAISHRGE